MEKLNFIETNTPTKLFAVARCWDNSQQRKSEKSPILKALFDHNLPVPLVVSAGTQLLFYSNNKREGMQDADYRIYIPLPEEKTRELINLQKEEKTRELINLQKNENPLAVYIPGEPLQQRFPTPEA